MQVVVPCTVMLPDAAGDINTLEQQVLAAGRQAMAAAMTQAWQQYQAEHVACPRCQSEATVADGYRPYHLRTRFGTVQLMRQRRRCRRCGRVFQPLDASLPTMGVGRATQGLVDAAVLAAASWPFATAARTLGSLSGADVSAEWVRQVTEAEGQVAAATAQQAAARCVTGQTATGPSPALQQLLIELDGGYVNSHDNAEGMEGKVAVVATGRERVGRERWRLTGRRYVASFDSAEAFGPRVYQAAAERGVEAAQQAVVLGDGARWITELAAWHFPDAERRLDLWHLLRRGHEAVSAEGLPDDVAAAVWDDLRGHLRRGAVDDALAVVTTRLTHPVGRAFAGYLRNQREWIVDAEALMAQGEVVGSGAIEKGVDLVINRRLKGRRGMKWWRTNADAIGMLRTQILNEEAEAA